MAAGTPSPLLGRVRAAVDILLREGVDRYGTEHSPLIASLLDCRSRKIPVRVPERLPGQRPHDRAPTGCNVINPDLNAAAYAYTSQSNASLLSRVLTHS